MIEIDVSLPAARVVRTLEQLDEIHSLPQTIRLNNGSELRSTVFIGWSVEKRGRAEIYPTGQTTTKSIY